MNPPTVSALVCISLNEWVSVDLPVRSPVVYVFGKSFMSVCTAGRLSMHRIRLLRLRQMVQPDQSLQAGEDQAYYDLKVTP